TLNPRLHVQSNAPLAGKSPGDVRDAGGDGGALEGLHINAVERGGRVFGIIALERILAVSDVKFSVIFGGQVGAEGGIGLDFGHGFIHRGLGAMLADSARASPKPHLEARGTPFIRPSGLEGGRVVASYFSTIVNLQS